MAAGLTQRQLAARVGVSRGAVQDWEAGVSYPDAHHLQALIVAFLEADGLMSGYESAEAEAMWAAVLREAPRMQTPFDASWWAAVLKRQPGSAAGEATPGQGAAVVTAMGSAATERRVDWGEAPDVLGFVGRALELDWLQRGVVQDGWRLVVVLGMGGIGKTMLAARAAQDVARHFERVYWRSMRNAPPFEEWLAGAIDVLAKSIGGRGKVGCIFHDATHYVTNRRDNAFKATIQRDYPNIQIVAQQGMADPARAEDAALAMLTPTPDLDGIYVPWLSQPSMCWPRCVTPVTRPPGS